MKVLGPIIAVLIIAASGWLLLNGNDPGTTTAPAATSIPPPDAIPSLVSVECRASSGGRSTDCYDAYLPWSRRVPVEDHVVIHVAVVSGGANAPADPVLFLHGGPAVPAMAEFLPAVGRGFQQMYGGRDVIVFDQRGAGLAGPQFDCSIEGTYRDSLNEDLAESSLEWLARQAMPCFAAADGVDLSVFATDEIAADAADIVRMLGYPSVNLHGSSFGSRIALTFAAQAASGVVRSVVLEGPYPPNIDGVARRGEAALAGLRALFAACSRDFECDSAYPELEAQLSAVVALLGETPVTLAGGEVVNGHRFMEVVYRTAYLGAGLRRIPRLIDDTASGDLALLDRLLDTTATTVDEIAPVAYFSTVCATTSPASEAALTTTVEALPDGFSAYFFDLAEATLDLCEGVGLVGGDADLDPTSGPTLYLVGKYDPVTPPTWSQQATDGLWPGFVVEFSYATHSNLLGPGTCAAQAVAEFVSTLEHPRPLCMSTTAPIDFDL
jgi:pimeloyl-ACP methyl ester carboxylesterase